MLDVSRVRYADARAEQLHNRSRLVYVMSALVGLFAAATLVGSGGVPTVLFGRSVGTAALFFGFGLWLTWAAGRVQRSGRSGLPGPVGAAGLFGVPDQSDCDAYPAGWTGPEGEETGPAGPLVGEVLPPAVGPVAIAADPAEAGTKWDPLLAEVW